MHLTAREKDKLLIAMAAVVARRRLERGVKLNHPEAVALISDFDGAGVLCRDQVMRGVPEVIREVQVEATVPDGAALLPVLRE